jgi:hypothetical protein
MNESNARRTLLVRAFEDPPSPPWTAADMQWANEAGARAAGEDAPAETFIVQRARVAHHRLVDRVPAIRSLEAALGWPRAFGPALALIALALGVAGDAVGSGQRINLLAPPLFLLLAWNLAVYLVIALMALRPGRPIGGPLRLALAKALQPMGAALLRALDTKQQPALTRFAADWAQAAKPLNLARLATALHAAAALFAIGALASLYLRGLAFEYLAGWDSTFLTPEAVHRLLSAVLAPASALSGLAVPGPAELARMRFSAGPGVNAARWIHLYALTFGLLIVLPRGLLAFLAAHSAQQLARRLPMPLDAPYFQRVLRGRSNEPVSVQVIPYSYRVPPAVRPGLGAALQPEFGGKLDVQIAEPVALGGEDTLGAISGAAGPVVALFPLTATPERENHGLFIDVLATRYPGRVSVLIDESGFRQRFPGNEGAARLAQRREAWQRLMAEHGQQPRFADLSGGLSA